MKKQLLAVLMAGIVAVGLCACSPEEEDYNDQGQITIEFFGWGDTAEQENYQTLINKFMEDNPDIVVSYKAESSSTYMTTLKNRANNLPDIFYLSDYDFLEWVAAGKVGYSALPDGAQVGYTAFSNVAMGMSDQAEPKQATGDIGASNYLYEDTYADAYNFSDASGVSLVGDDANMLVGAKQLTLGADGDFASYLVRFGADARYGLEMVYAAADGGKTIEVTYGGTTYECTLPAVQTEDAFVKAIVCEFDAKAGISAVSIGSAGDAFTFVSVSFTETSPVTPVYEQSLATYAEKGADYKTIWKIKDEGHYAKAGTRQLVYFGDDRLTDFTLEVELKLEGNTGTSTAGIVFHAKNYAASSYDSYTSLQGYYLAVNNNQISLERLNYADGSTSLATVVANNPFATSDVFVSLKIVVRGNTIQVYTGGSDTPIIELTDTWAFTSGKLGLYTNGAAVVYKNLKVSA